LADDSYEALAGLLKGGDIYVLGVATGRAGAPTEHGLVCLAKLLAGARTLAIFLEIILFTIGAKLVYALVCADCARPIGCTVLVSECV